MSALKFGQPGVSQITDTKKTAVESGVEKPIAATEVAAVESPTEKPEVEVQPAAIFSCHPTQALKIGRFKFERAQLKFHSAADTKEFETLLKQQPALIQNQVRKIDVSAAEAMIKASQQPRMNAGVDTTANTLTPTPVQEA